MIFVGYVLMLFWLVFYTFAYLDLYLAYPLAGDILKLFFPPALVINLVGLVAALSGRYVQGRERLLLCLLNALPLIAAALFIWWLFFSLKI